MLRGIRRLGLRPTHCVGSQTGSPLSERILAALNQHKRALAMLIHREMTHDTRAQLDSLFAQAPFPLAMRRPHLMRSTG